MKHTRSKLQQIISEEVDWYDVEKGHETMADRKFADRPGDIEGAGADRVSMGMRKSFGRTVGTAARVKSGQKLITLRTSDEFVLEAKEALRKSSHKLPTPCNIVVNQK